MSSVGQLWQEVLGTQRQLPLAGVLGCAAAGLAAVAVRAVWRVLRGVVTIAHEGGHALVALFVGRRLAGIRLHSDTSGVTISRGRPTGPGMVATALAGYLAPSVLGVGFAGMLTWGRITALLWISIALLAVMVLAVRNVYGVVSILVTALALFVVSWFGSAAVQAALAYSFTWFLLFAAFRPLAEVQRKRAAGHARDSDPDQLARLTRVPGLVWLLVFGLVAAGALGLAATWLVPFADLRAWWAAL
ncbi:M50 family metallopeptidase [Actinopolymorpha pittospori]|uniref:ABC-type multidrug transport system fused ATPase/permease subunit n=1 Tax=Actinopolymorpha pittospori TaxID=648752 RepID=A0A927N250_9ACTN|nr:M50 family metallopeptidase [Actinopolymorpha pittospori]MBE1609563.1 ABC-type multidrug transport system fused ATPase/permease subunit [Actinopolymorpha pittospori]